MTDDEIETARLLFDGPPGTEPTGSIKWVLVRCAARGHNGAVVAVVTGLSTLVDEYRREHPHTLHRQRPHDPEEPTNAPFGVLRDRRIPMGDWHREVTDDLDALTASGVPAYCHEGRRDALVSVEELRSERAAAVAAHMAGPRGAPVIARTIRVTCEPQR